MSSTKTRQRSNRNRRGKRREAWLTQASRLVGSFLMVFVVAAAVHVTLAKWWDAPVTPQAPAPRSVADSIAAAAVQQTPATPKADSSNPAPALPTPPRAIRISAGIDEIDSKRPQLEALLTRFFAAKTVEEKLATVRHPQRVAPLMKSFYERQPLQPQIYRSLSNAVSLRDPGYRFGYVEALLTDDTAATLIIEETDDAHLLVDWESAVQFSEMPWNEFLRDRPIEARLMRVIASRHPSSADWIELRHPSDPGRLRSFLDKSDQSLRSLIVQLEAANWRDAPVTLRIGFPAAATDNQTVAIAAVEGKGWLILD